MPAIYDCGRSEGVRWSGRTVLGHATASVREVRASVGQQRYPWLGSRGWRDIRKNEQKRGEIQVDTRRCRKCGEFFKAAAPKTSTCPLPLNGDAPAHEPGRGEIATQSSKAPVLRLYLSTSAFRQAPQRTAGLQAIRSLDPRRLTPLRLRPGRSRPTPQPAAGRQELRRLPNVSNF